MKKLLVMLLMLGLASSASAAVTTIDLIAPGAGALGSSTNKMDDVVGKDTLRVYLAVDTDKLGTLVGYVNASKNSAITGATGKSDLQKPWGSNVFEASFEHPSMGWLYWNDWQDGWEAAASYEDVVGTASVHVGLGTGATANGAITTTAIPTSEDAADLSIGDGGPLAYVDIAWVGYDVVLSLDLSLQADSDTWGWTALMPGNTGDTWAGGSAITIYQVPEPMTIGLLGLGSLVLLRRRRK